MPDRVIRDELLTSERYWSVSNEAKLLFMHLLLVADDFGNAHGSHFSIRTKCFAGAPIENALIDGLLDQIAAVDLVRIYQIDAVRYVHIPRFRQRVRYVKRAFTLSPWNKYKDIENKDIEEKKSDYSQSLVGLESVEVKRSEIKGSSSTTDVDLECISNVSNGAAKKNSPLTAPMARLTFEKIPTSKPKPKPAPTVGYVRDAFKTPEGTDKLAKQLGLKPKAGEDYAQFRDRIMLAIAQRKREGNR